MTIYALSSGRGIWGFIIRISGQEVSEVIKAHLLLENLKVKNGNPHSKQYQHFELIDEA